MYTIAPMTWNLYWKNHVLFDCFTLLLEESMLVSEQWCTTVAIPWKCFVRIFKKILDFLFHNTRNFENNALWNYDKSGLLESLSCTNPRSLVIKKLLVVSMLKKVYGNKSLLSPLLQISWMNCFKDDLPRLDSCTTYLQTPNH